MRLIPPSTASPPRRLPRGALSAGAATTATSECSNLIQGTDAPETITATASGKGNHVLGLAGDDTITGGRDRIASRAAVAGIA